MTIKEVLDNTAKVTREDFPPQIQQEGWLVPLDELEPYQAPLLVLPYEASPQVGDTVLVAAKPFTKWLMAYDHKRNREFWKYYNYSLMERRADKLDKWLHATSTVVKLNPPMALLKANGLGIKALPIDCLRVLHR